jgi:uncharacterized cupin superfamily protein
MMQEAELTPTEHGLVRTGPGWFVANVKDVRWLRHETFGEWTNLDGDHRFEQVGVHLAVLRPGRPACLYHRENKEEHFLVLEGECTLVVEEEERALKKWDFVHCAPGTDHVFVGAGDGPCIVLMMGSREGKVELCYPPSVTAAKYGASSEKETDSPMEAYARFGQRKYCRPPAVIE